MNKKSEKTLEHTNTQRNQNGRSTTRSIYGLLMIALLIGSSAFFATVKADPANVSNYGVNINGQICATGTNATLFDWGQCPSLTTIGNGIFGASSPTTGQPIPGHLPAGTVPGTAFFFNDFVKSNDLTVYSGSNKNDDPLNVWHWLSNTSSLQAKDDMTRLYTLIQSAPKSAGNITAGDEILYVGSERISPSGDAHFEVEYFQAAVGLNNNTQLGGQAYCTLPNPYCTFSGQRTTGDLLLSMDYVQGGALGSVTLFSWNASGGNVYAQTATISAKATGLSCSGNGFICAENNPTTIQSGPWGYIAKGASAPCFGVCVPTNSFTELAIDVTPLVHFKPCIASILPKTRSSQSFDSTLQDFITPHQTGGCSANIRIQPDKVNQAGATHTFTVNVTKSVSPSVIAPAPGTLVTVTLTPTLGANINGTSTTPVNETCTTDSSGLCNVSFFSTTPGLVVGHAFATVNVNGSPRFVQTNTTGNSPDAFKRFVDARIGITPSKVNEVGQSHTFTVTVTQNFGNVSATNYVAAPGVFPTVTLTPSAPVLNKVDSCAGTGTNSAGQCTVSFSSNTPGTIVGSACVTFTMTAPNTGTLINPTITLTRCTNGINGDTGNATKRFVNMSIIIAPNATNSIYDPHTFTVTVTANTGNGIFAVMGAFPAVTLTPSGATIINKVDTCANNGVNTGTDSFGKCTVTFSSNTAGTVIATATVTVTFSTSQGMITVTRSTDGNTFLGNSFGAMKTFLVGSLSWEKVDNLGQPLAGATFQVMRLCDYHVSTQTCDGPTAPPTITFTVTSGTGFFSVTGLRLGKYQVTETIAPAGYALDPTVKTAFVNDTNLNINIGVFSDQRPILKLTGFGYNNTLTGNYGQSNTTASGIAIYTVTIHNFGGASGFFNITLTISGGGTGTLTCSNPTGPAPYTTLTGCTLTAVNVPIAAAGNPGDTFTFTLKLTYTNIPNGTAIFADLTGSYNTVLGDGGIRTINGTPAEIKFTAQGN